MTAPFAVQIVNAALAEKARGMVTLGGRFVFVADGALLDAGRRSRLQGWRSAERRVIKAAVDGPLTLCGLALTSMAPAAPRACAVLADRDLYRTETDTARVVCVLPRLSSGERARLELSLDGQPLTGRDLTAAEGGLVVEPFGALVAGRYEAALLIDGDVVAGPCAFTVADYTLAPLSMRLTSRHVEDGELVLTLAVETWQVPCGERLRLSLLEGERAHETREVEASAPGVYEVRFSLVGDGALKVRAIVADDPSRSAEAAIPGSRRTERELVVINELGKEVRLSMLPTPRSLPVRGVYLDVGEAIGTPIVVDEVVTATPTLRTVEAVSALTVAWWLPLSGRWVVEEIGDIAAGQRVALQPHEPLAVCFVACFVGEQPFEAMTTFLRPDDDAELVVEHPTEVRPNGMLPVTVKTNGMRRVLLAIKDERITSTDTPQVALQARIKEGITTLASVLGDDFAFVPAEQLVSSATGHAAGIVVHITDESGAIRRHEFRQRDVTIGRATSTDVPLSSGKLSKQHARVVLRDGNLIVVDLGSTNGTYVNGGRISGPRVLHPLDRVHIGGFTLTFSVLAEQNDYDYADDDFDGVTLAGVPVPSSALDDRPAPRAATRVGFTAEPQESGRTMMIDRSELAMAAFVDELDEEAPVPPPAAGASRGGVTGDGRAADEQRPRETFPEILFFGVLDVDGVATVEVPAGESLAAFTVVAFALIDGAPAQRESRVQVDQPTRADLDLPLEIAGGDVAEGVLRVATRSGAGFVTLTRDGAGVPLALRGQLLGDGLAGVDVKSGARLTFAVAPGRYRARVEDPATGDTDAVEVTVGTPGVFVRLCRELAFVPAGKSLTLGDGDMLTLRVLPGLSQPMQTLCQATITYDHACCEQTASKLVAAAAMLLTASSPYDKDTAMRALVAGVARERRMWVRGRGFRLYPNTELSTYYSPLTVEHLWRLRRLADVKSLPGAAREAVAEAIAMADDVGGALRQRYVPAQISSAHDAWAVATRDPGRVKEALEWVGKAIAIDDQGPRSKLNGAIRGNVALRSLFAYGSAVAMVGKKTTVALRLAQEVLKSLDEHGRLYSTIDSVAAIAMMGELARAGVVGGTGQALVNGTRMIASEAATLGDTVESIAVEEGVVGVEIVRLKEERLTEERGTVQVKVALRGEGDSAAVLQRGRSVELSVSLPDGYREGDLVQVSLPPCLAWLHGGGRVKRFTIDFQGKSVVRVPLAVIADLPGRQTLFVAVRNMFEEERLGVPGPIALLPGTSPSPSTPAPEASKRSAGVLSRLLGRKG